MEYRESVDYSELHQVDSPANRLMRKTIWGDQDIGQQSFITPRYLDELIERTSINADSCVLDIGCGVGGPSVYVAKKTGCRIMGIDVSDVGVKRAKKFAEGAGLGDRASFHLGDAMDMPFPDNTFDVAFSLNVMNVFEDKVGLFRQVLRVLKPKGLLTFLSGAVDMPDDPEVYKRMTRGCLITEYYDTATSYKAKLKEAGFQVVEVTEYVEDCRLQVSLWGDAFKKHYDAIVKEQGKETTDHHVKYFETYVGLIDEGRAGNFLFISRKPEG